MNLSLTRSYSARSAMVLINTAVNILERGYFGSLRGQMIKSAIEYELEQFIKSRAPHAIASYDAEVLTIGDVVVVISEVYAKPMHDDMSRRIMLLLMKKIVDELYINGCDTKRINDIIMNEKTILN